MLSADEIQTSLTGAWHLMMGKADGVRLLDLSADGFWNSFFALVVAAPALIVGWVSIANEIGDPYAFSGRLGVLIRVALVDVGAWTLPLVALAVVSRYAGIATRFVPYVVASNWASALIAWISLPSTLIRLVQPSSGQVVKYTMLVFFLLSMVLMWRMTNAVIGRGVAVGSTVFAGMFIAWFVAVFVLQMAFGLSILE